MITPKAIELSKQAREQESQTAAGLAKAQRLASEFFDELFTNCQPTEEEFTEYSNGIILTGDALWKMMEYMINEHINERHRQLPFL